jgi:hypothetical protein
MLSIIASQICYPEIIIRSIFSISNNIISSIQYLKLIAKADCELYQILEESDVLSDIGIMKSFIDETKIKGNAMKIAVNNLQETLNELDSLLNKIMNKVHNHRNLWFHRFRSFDISNDKLLLIILIKRLKHRFTLLINITA